MQINAESKSRLRLVKRDHDILQRVGGGFGSLLDFVWSSIMAIVINMQLTQNKHWIEGGYLAYSDEGLLADEKAKIHELGQRKRQAGVNWWRNSKSLKPCQAKTELHVEKRNLRLWQTPEFCLARGKHGSFYQSQRDVRTATKRKKTRLSRWCTWNLYTKKDRSEKVLRFAQITNMRSLYCQTVVLARLLTHVASRRRPPKISQIHVSFQMRGNCVFGYSQKIHECNTIYQIFETIKFIF